MIKNIIFDWSGVVKDSMENHLFVVNKVFEEVGVKPISTQELKENWRQPYMDFFNQYAPNLTLEEEQRLYKKWLLVAPEFQTFPGIVALIKECQSQGKNMFVLSADFIETLLPEIEKFDLKGTFVEVIGNSHDKTADLLKLVSKHKLELAGTIFIGDTNHEIETAREIGILSGAVTWGWTTKEKLVVLKPDYLFENLEEMRRVLNS